MNSDYITQVVRQWAGGDTGAKLDRTLVSRFLAENDPYPAGFEVYVGRDSRREVGVIEDRIGRSRWLVKRRDDPTHVEEADACDLAPRAPVMTTATPKLPASVEPADVCVESSEENMVPEMALHAHCLLSGTWNGWAKPVATAREVADFLARWRRNDPNGVWGYAVAVDDALLVTRSDAEDPDYFASVGEASDGQRLYDLTGWVWSELAV